MTSTVEIDPCTACQKRYEKGGCDVNNINNCCYDTLAAFTGAQNVLNISKVKNCTECVNKYIRAAGKTTCDLNIDPPPLWNNIPHYFPTLLAETGDKDVSLQKCVEKCQGDSLNRNACILNCQTDYDAVVKVPKTPVKASTGATASVSPPSPTLPPFWFWALVITAIVLVVAAAAKKRKNFAE